MFVNESIVRLVSVHSATITGGGGLIVWIRGTGWGFERSTVHAQGRPCRVERDFMLVLDLDVLSDERKRPGRDHTWWNPSRCAIQPRNSEPATLKPVRSGAKKRRTEIATVEWKENCGAGTNEWNRNESREASKKNEKETIRWKIKPKWSQYQDDWRSRHHQSVACPTCTCVRTLRKHSKTQNKEKRNSQR